MGILKNRCIKNILTDHGFEFTRNNASMDLVDCYETSMPIGNLYYIYVAVKPHTKEFAYYLEYECGGKVASGCYTLDNLPSFEDDPEGFFNGLDEEVTDLVEMWS